MYPDGKMGKERSFGRGILLIIVTFGIYALYWHYKARKELLDQYRVREFPTGLYILCFIPLANIVGEILFMSGFIDDINAIRQKLNMPPTLTFGSFLAWYVLGSFIVVGPFIAYYKLQTAINDIWKATPGTAAPMGQPAPTQA